MSDDEATDSTEGDAPDSPPEGDENRGRQLVEQVAEYDTDLARDVKRILERGAQLHDAAGELEANLQDREQRIEQLESELDERDERIEQLEAELDGDDSPDGAEGQSDETGEGDEDGADPERVDELEAELDERDQRIEQLEADLEAAEADLEDREADLDDLEAEVDDLKERLKRKQADFENYKRRAERKREQIQERATEDLVERLLNVRDNLRRALENEHTDVESLREGVRMTLQEFDRVLDAENVSEIAPDPGTEVDPERHEVMMRVDSDHPDGAVAELYAPGYQMADKVIRPAQVTVSTGPADGEETTTGDGTGDELEEETDEHSAAATAQGNEAEEPSGTEDGDGAHSTGE